jgi:1-deoxy-D-xylulose-5-phosphate synthase
VGLLETIKRPDDLRQLSRRLLGEVARELRDELIGIGSTIGGHFAGSLGTVELSIALHYVYDTPTDRVIWDVGHQAYGHKALTGRREGLWQIKKAHGPSGFLRRSESPYDVFGAGHAGTSVSAALGIAEAARRKGETKRVVAVIGDGASTSGMSFEGLNHAGHLSTPICIIYNENGMSIAPNVGGLNKTRDVQSYVRALGLEYRGPIDGHDLGELVPALEEARRFDGPIVLHVKTQKGHGYAPAEADPFRWHATAPFERASGDRKKGSAGPPSWTACFADALERLAARDPRLVAITAAMPDGTGLDKFGKAYPDRVYDVGIAEQHAVTFAAGLATEGLRPVCAIYSTFLQRGFDQIVHDVALQNLPVLFAIDRAGLVGADGPTHHGLLDITYLRGVPNLVIAAPRDENQLQHLLATGLESDGPFAVRYPRGAATGMTIDAEPKAVPIGRGELLRGGTDVALVALGKSVAVAESAADLLRDSGVSAAVVDARFAKPLDTVLLGEMADRCGYLVTLEDHFTAGGFGSAVLEELSTSAPDTRLLRVGLGDAFVEHGETDDQWRQAEIDAEAVAQRTLGWLPKGTSSLRLARGGA